MVWLRSVAHRTVVAVVIACGLASTLRAAPPSDAELLAKVDTIAAEYLKKPGAAGLSIAIARDGKSMLSKGYGLADIEFDVPADAQTMFRIGSVTKQFTSAAIMRLIEQGKLSLDDPMTKFLPDYPMQGNVVTIRNLLNHTSGIASYTDIGEEWEKLAPLELTHEQMLALVKDKPFDFKPGEQWRYNNTGYYILGMIIEKISGKSYADYVQDEFFGPLSLERTRYEVSSEIIRNRARGYGVDKGITVNCAPLGMSQPYAAGSLISTAEDLTKWSMALSSGKVVTPESFALMTTPTTLADGTTAPYGFGLAMDNESTPRRIWHNGGIFGFNSMLVWLPESDTHIAVISNAEPIISDRLGDELVYVALGIEKPAAKDLAISADVLALIVGTYAFDQAPMSVNIRNEGGKVAGQASGEGQGPFRLLYQGSKPDGAHEFRIDADPDAKILFTRDGQSLVLEQRGMRMTAKRST